MGADLSVLEKDGKAYYEYLNSNPLFSGTPQDLTVLATQFGAQFNISDAENPFFHQLLLLKKFKINSTMVQACRTSHNLRYNFFASPCFYFECSLQKEQVLNNVTIGNSKCQVRVHSCLWRYTTDDKAGVTFDGMHTIYITILL